MAAETRGESVYEPARELPVAAEADVLVVGGGSAGVAAAAAAARRGARVLLVEGMGFLGGTLTAVTLGSIVGFFTVVEGRPMAVVRGLAEEVVDRLRAMGGAGEPKRFLKTASVPYDIFALKLVCDELVEAAGVRLLLHAWVTDVVMDGPRLRGVVVESKSGRFALLARAVIDCTGDADVAARAGAPFTLDVPHLQRASAAFRMAGADAARVDAVSREELNTLLEQAAADGFPLPRTAGGVFATPGRPGLVHLNVTRVGLGDGAADPTDAWQLTAAEVEGRRQVRLYQEVLRRYVPGMAGAYVVDAGARLGIRESRMIAGEYTMTTDDVLGARQFPDAIACGCWPLEIHDQGRATIWRWLEPGAYYQIPYRTLVPLNVEGLLVAGRCVAATHEAQASVRAGAVCIALGEAAGVAAAMAVGQGVPVRRVDVAALQQQLRQQGAFLGNGAPQEGG